MKRNPTQTHQRHDPHAAALRAPEGLEKVGAKLIALGVEVLNFRLDRPGSTGNETFHAKAVLGDDDTDLVTNLVKEAQKRRSPHGAGFVSACRHSYFLVAGAGL